MSKSSAGRPTKYKKEYCDLLKSHNFVQEFMTVEMFACKLGVHKDTIYEWAKIYPQFSDALRIFRQGAHAHLQRIGMAGMVGKIRGFRENTWKFWMQCQFGWNDGTGQDQEDNQLIIEHLDE